MGQNYLKMNCTNKNIHRIQNSWILYVTNLILFCAVILACCEATEDANNRIDLADVKRVDMFSKTHNIPWPYSTRENRMVRKYIPKIKDNEEYNGVLMLNENDARKRIRIQEKHKRRLRNRNKHHNLQNREDSQPHNRTNLKNIYLNYVESEKKYFDYIPVEDMQEKYLPLKDDDSTGMLLLLDNNNTGKIVFQEKLNQDRRSQKLRRLRREILNQETHSRTNYNYVRNFLAHEQGNKPSEAILPSERKINQGSPSYLYESSNDPWNNRFTRPLNGFYLSPTSRGHIKYPIPGIYYNPVSPVGTYPVIRRQGGISPSFSNRFGADEDRVIWSIEPITGSRDRPSSSSAGQTPTTRRPPPPLIHGADREQSQRPSQKPTQGPLTSVKQPNTVSNSINNQRTPLITTTRRPDVATSSPSSKNGSEPSKCVWAIVTCCSRNNLQVRYSCFEQIGCHGAFWDLNPCADELQDAALQQAGGFFQ